MAKKIKLKFNPDEDDYLIGISFQRNDYLLAFGIKTTLNLDLRRKADLPVPAANGAATNLIPFFYYDDADNLKTYFLIANRGSEGRLFPSLKNIDYFLLINGSGTIEEREALITGLRKLKYVLTAFPIDIKSIKQADMLMSYLELHLIEINRSGQEQD